MSSHGFQVPKALASISPVDANNIDFTQDTLDDTSISTFKLGETKSLGSGYEAFQNESSRNDSFVKEMPEFSDDDSCNEEYQSGDEGDLNSDIDGEDDDGSGENDDKEMQDINSEMTEDIKNQLLYSGKNLSDNHIFFVLDPENAPVVKSKKMLENLKCKLDEAKSGDAENLITLERNLKGKEQEFIKLYIRKITFDKKLPVTEPLSKDMRNNIYKRRNHPPHIFKIVQSFEQKRMKRKLIKVRNQIIRMETTQNKYLDDMKNYLNHLEREYKDNFMVPKTSEDMEIDEMSRTNSKQAYASLNIQKKPWINELTTGNKKQLMYTKAASTDNQLFWVYNYGKQGVKQTKWQCFHLKQLFHDAIAKGNEAETKAAEKRYRERENYFINTFVHKIQFDENLPRISPLPLELRNALYNESGNMYRVQRSSQQARMLKELKKLNEVVRQLLKIDNKFSPNVANDLYHKEIEYKKCFLHCLNDTLEEQIFKSELDKPFDQRLRKIKREKKMPKRSKLIKPQIAMDQQYSGIGNTFNQKMNKSQSKRGGAPKNFRFQGFQNQRNLRFQNESRQWGFRNQPGQGRVQNQISRGDSRGQSGFQNRSYQTGQFKQGGFLQMEQNQYGLNNCYGSESSHNRFSPFAQDSFGPYASTSRYHPY